MYSDANFLDKYVCSFCENEVSPENIMFGVNEAVICCECIDLYYDIFNISKERDIEIPKCVTPKAIYNQLSKIVVGQELAKKVLSVAIVNHYKRIKYNLNIDKSNVLMIGPSGSGKTLLAKTLAKIINVPIAIVDATVYTEAGYVGEDVENILLRLLQNADYDKEQAERGIVFIDEIDKLSKKSENPSITRDVSGEGVQNSLLKIIEGNVINISPHGGRKHPYQDFISFDTSNVLFICAGAFDGLALDDKSNTLGIIKNDKIFNKDLNSELIKYGLIPELLGRLPLKVVLNSLSKNELKQILMLKDYGVISQYQKLFEIDGVNLSFDDLSIDKIVELAFDSKSGARSLKQILENIMLDIMFDIDSNTLNNECLITESIVCENYNHYMNKI